MRGIRTARAADKAVVNTVSLRVFLVCEIAAVTHQQKGLGGFRGSSVLWSDAVRVREGDHILQSDAQPTEKAQCKHFPCISCTFLHNQESAVIL